MEARHKILVLDDDSEWLDISRDLLSQLPSKPEIHTVGSGARAVAELETEPFRLLICDLRLPRLDGFQVLSIVRWRFPDLRTVVLTAMESEENRKRAYALGVDLFWHKLDMQQNPRLFLDCIESLLAREDGEVNAGPKENLLDVIRLQLALRNTSLLRAASGPLAGHIWIQDGQLIDARVEEMDGEEAFRRILKWKACAVEILPGEGGHAQTINKSLDALVLESVQAVEKAAYPTAEQKEAEAALVNRLTAMACEGAEFVVTVPDNESKAEGCGAQDADAVATWAREAAKAAQRLGQKLDAGPWTHIAANNQEQHLVLLPGKAQTFVTGWPPTADPGRLVEQSKKLADTWGA